MNGVDYSAVLVKYVALSALFAVALIAALVFLAVVAWRLFEKLEYRGWLGLVPFVNLYILFKVTKLYLPTLPLLLAAPIFAWALSLYPSPSLLLILAAAPAVLALILIWIRFAIGLANAFDKGVKFAVLTVIFPVIFIPYLALSSTKYFSKM